MTGNRTQTASWIAYSILQFIIMFVSVFVYSVACFNDSLLRLFGRSVYVQRSSGMHLVLHILQIVAWFPISLLCLSDKCDAVAVTVGSVWKPAWHVVFLFVKCSCTLSTGYYAVVALSPWADRRFLQIFS